MYDLYTTKGFIVMARYTGEDSRIYHILTEDLGLITARGQGVRKLTSKLKFHLQFFRELEITLVRGRDFWRITGATSLTEQLFSEAAQAVWLRLGMFLRRQLLYQQPDGELFQMLEVIAGRLGEIPEESILDYEQVARAHVLNHLGYWNAEVLPGLATTEYRLSRAAQAVLRQAEAAAGV